jgi:hypothetical protein
MKNISDETLNRFIDEELTPEEMNSINEYLKTDHRLRKRLYSLKLIHSELKLIIEDEVLPDFTKRLMQRISKKYRVPKEQKVFISFMLSFFGFLCLSILGYIFFIIYGEISQAVSSDTNQTINHLSHSLVRFITDALSGINISVVGSILSILILVSGYYFFEMTKQSKTKLSG